MAGPSAGIERVPQLYLPIQRVIPNGIYGPDGELLVDLTKPKPDNQPKKLVFEDPTWQGYADALEEFQVGQEPIKPSRNTEKDQDSQLKPPSSGVLKYIKGHHRGFYAAASLLAAVGLAVGGVQEAKGQTPIQTPIPGRTQSLPDSFQSAQKEYARTVTTLGTPTQRSTRTEATAQPETVRVSDYRMEDMAVSGTSVTGLIQHTDGSYRVVAGNLTGSVDNLVLKEIRKSRINTPIGVAVSPNNPNVKLVFGSDKPIGGIGTLELTTDGGLNWREFSGGNSGIQAGVITPDSKYAFLTIADPQQENWPGYWKFDLSTGGMVQLNMDNGLPISGQTGVGILSGPAGTGYISYSISYRHGGHFENHFYPDGTFHALQINADKYGATGGPYWFVDALGRNNIFTHESYTYGTYPNNPNRGVATLYHTVDGVYRNSFQPKESLYYDQLQFSNDPILVSNVVIDPKFDIGYMVVSPNIDNNYYPHIEIFSLADPTNYNNRTRVPEDGDYPKNTPYGGTLSDLGIIRNGVDTHLVFSIATVRRLPGSGLYLRRTTDGIQAADAWKRVAIELSSGITSRIVFLPYLSR